MQFSTFYTLQVQLYGNLYSHLFFVGIWTMRNSTIMPLYENSTSAYENTLVSWIMIPERIRKYPIATGIMLLGFLQRWFFYRYSHSLIANHISRTRLHS